MEAFCQFSILKIQNYFLLFERNSLCTQDLQESFYVPSKNDSKDVTVNEIQMNWIVVLENVYS